MARAAILKLVASSSGNHVELNAVLAVPGLFQAQICSSALGRTFGRRSAPANPHLAAQRQGDVFSEVKHRF